MVKYRNVVFVIVISIITGGIYAVYWLVSTTNELRRMTSSAPNPWFLLLMLVPIANIIVFFWYYWKYSKAIGEISDFDPVLLFVLWVIISPVAMIIAQIQLNKKARASV